MSADKILDEGTTSITGLYPGETIIGLKCTGQDSIMRLVKGVIPASATAIKTVIEADKIYELHQYFQSLNFDEQRIEFILRSTETGDIHYTQYDLVFQVIRLGNKALQKLKSENNLFFRKNHL